MNSQPDILKSIVQHKRLEIANSKSAVSLAELKERIESASPPRGFKQRICERLNSGQFAVIAESKRASPSKGVIRANYDVQEIAASYERGGATCLSVLTDEKYFKGSMRDLEVARSACSLPALRKDFVIDLYQVYESRAGGADCILLIVAVLESNEMFNLGTAANDLGMDVLVEVHSREELDSALELPFGLIGVNNRNLRTFETRIETSINLAGWVPDDRIVVSESGIHTPQDVERLKFSGISAYLVGESLMNASDPGARLNALFYNETALQAGGLS